jgi:hypothetical protein
MLRNFLYLNTVALDGYIGAVEDGLRQSLEDEQSGSANASVGADVKFVNANAGKVSGVNRKLTGLDTPEARFSRLINIAEKDPEPLGWVEVLDPDSDLGDIGIGAMISGEADFYIPRMVGLLTSGELGRAIDMIDSIEPLADMLSLDKQGLPGKGERAAVRSAVDALRADIVTVGEFEESSWKVAGQLSNDFTRAQVDGPARFAGKVSKQWPAGEGRHLLALPGSTLLPRHERRALQKKKPENPDDDSFLIGPALMLDVLAIWR